MPTTPGQQQVIRFIEETTPGTTPTNPALLLFSKETTRVKFGKDQNMKESLSTDNREVDSLFTAKSSYSVDVEFNVYDAARIFVFLQRKSDGTPRSFTLELISDQDQATIHYYRGTGWKPKTVKWSSAPGDPWKVVVTFEAGIWANPVTTAPSIGTGSRELKAAVTEGLKTFASGVILFDGAAWATLTGATEFTFDHGVNAYWTTGSANPVTGITNAGVRRIKGKTDVSLDNGAADFYALVDAFATHTLVIPFGAVASGKPKLTFTGVTLPKFNAEFTPDKDVIMAGEEWQALTYAEGTA